MPVCAIKMDAASSALRPIMVCLMSHVNCLPYLSRMLCVHLVYKISVSARNQASFFLFFLMERQMHTHTHTHREREREYSPRRRPSRSKMTCVIPRLLIPAILWPGHSQYYYRVNRSRSKRCAEVWLRRLPTLQTMSNNSCLGFNKTQEASDVFNAAVS